jgi:hypothetical protein
MSIESQEKQILQEIIVIVTKYKDTVDKLKQSVNGGSD